MGTPFSMGYSFCYFRSEVSVCKELNTGTWTTQVTKRVHPEMEGVEPGEELMGVTFEPKSCDIEEYNELQERINQLQSKLEDPWEDDDDDGDVPAVVKR